MTSKHASKVLFSSREGMRRSSESDVDGIPVLQHPQGSKLACSSRIRSSQLLRLATWTAHPLHSSQQHHRLVQPVHASTPTSIHLHRRPSQGSGASHDFSTKDHISPASSRSIGVSLARSVRLGGAAPQALLEVVVVKPTVTLRLCLCALSEVLGPSARVCPEMVSVPQKDDLKVVSSDSGRTTGHPLAGRTVRSMLR